MSDSGRVTLVNATAASGVSGAIDETTAGGGRFLYVQVGLGSSVNAYAVHWDGTLSLIQTVAVPEASARRESPPPEPLRHVSWGRGCPVSNRADSRACGFINGEHAG